MSDTGNVHRYLVTAPLTLAAALLALAACGSQPAPATTPTASHATAATGTPAASTSPPGGILTVHDPGHVTYSTGKPAPGTCHTRGGGQLPDPSPSCTPGATDPAVDQANIAVTICKPGYTATVRPPSSETNAAKFGVSYPAYSVPQGAAGEEDHEVPLELGGANDISNLWPQIGTIPNAKDKVEGDLHRAVCAGKTTLVAAQDAIASNWTAAEQRLGIRSRPRGMR